MIRKQTSLLVPSFLNDPYPTYHALRAAGPLHWSEEFFGGAWLVPRYADVMAVLRDPRFSSRRAGGWVNGSVETHEDDFGAYLNKLPAFWRSHTDFPADADFSLCSFRAA